MNVYETGSLKMFKCSKTTKGSASDGSALDSRPRGPGFDDRKLDNHGSQEVRVRSLIKWLPPIRNKESNNDLLMMQELLDYI